MTEYPRIQELKALCESFKGQAVQLNATFMGRAVAIANPNLVGDLLEDIFFPIFKEKFADFEEGPLQDPPDYYAAGKAFAFEQKVFSSKNGPGFDVAPFPSLVDTLANGNLIYKLFKTKYLVFEYIPEGGVFTIKNFWLLNMWQLPNYYDAPYGSHKPMSMQVKRNIWYNVRPGSTSSWLDPTKTAQKFLEKLIASIDLAPNINNKEAAKASILKQMEEARTLGFL